MVVPRSIKDPNVSSPHLRLALVSLLVRRCEFKLKALARNAPRSGRQSVRQGHAPALNQATWSLLWFALRHRRHGASIEVNYFTGRSDILVDTFKNRAALRCDFPTPPSPSSSLSLPVSWSASRDRVFMSPGGRVHPNCTNPKQSGGCAARLHFQGRFRSCRSWLIFAMISSATRGFHCSPCGVDTLRDLCDQRQQCAKEASHRFWSIKRLAVSLRFDWGAMLSHRTSMENCGAFCREEEKLNSAWVSFAISVLLWHVEWSWWCPSTRMGDFEDGATKHSHQTALGPVLTDEEEDVRAWPATIE